MASRRRIGFKLSYHVLCGFPKATLTNHEYTQVTAGQVEDLKLKGEAADVTSGPKKVSNVTQAVSASKIKPSELIESLTHIRKIYYSGGVVHIIDAVLVILENASTTASEEDLTALLESVMSTALTGTLDTTPDLTIFAPSNAAFDALSTSLISASTEDIAKILRYHVIKGTVAYSSILSNKTVRSLLGPDLTITVGADGSVYVNNAKVVLPNVLLSNDVVQVIDAVLEPDCNGACIIIII